MNARTDALYAEIRDALQQAGRLDLVARLDAHLAADTLTSSEAAAMLGVSSRNTVKNWLAGGAFPGAFQTAGGHWRFPRADVEAVKARMDAIRTSNRDGHIDPPDIDDDADPPLL